MIYKKFIFTAVLIGFAGQAFAQDAGKPVGPTGSAFEDCDADLRIQELKTYPIKDLTKLPTGQVEEGLAIKTKIGTVDGKRIVSTISPSISMFFMANVYPQFAGLDAKQTAAFATSLPIGFLKDYGLKEMSLLGPDLSKADPFLDMPAAQSKSPSEEKVDQTNIKISELAARMNGYLGNDQRTAIQHALAGDFQKSIDQVAANTRMILAKLPFASNALSGIVNDKKFLQDIQHLLANNHEQFERDIVFMDIIQSRYRKTKEGLEKLVREGEAISAMKAAIVASVTDEYTKQQVQKELVRFDDRLTSLKAGIAVAETFMNMWEIIKDNHYNVMAGIKRALYLTIPIIGATAQATAAIERQDRSSKAIKTMDDASYAYMQKLNKMLGASVEARNKAEVESIQKSADALGELLIGTMLVEQAMLAHDVQKVELLRQAREKYEKIANDAQKRRQASGLDRI